LILGKGEPVEGKVFVLETDGRLRPIDGADLLDLHQAFPNFVKHWRLDDGD
jgi:hypothetical protein